MAGGFRCDPALDAEFLSRGADQDTGGRGARCNPFDAPRPEIRPSLFLGAVSVDRAMSPPMWSTLLEKVKGVGATWSVYTALGSFVLYFLGYLVLHFQLATWGVITDL